MTNLRALFGGLSTQAGAFEPLNGPDARAIAAAPWVRQPLMFLELGYMGNLGHFIQHGVNDAPLVGRAPYGGIAPNDPLSPRLERMNPWTDPASALR